MVISKMYKHQIDRLDRMFTFITQDERFKSLDRDLKVDIILSFFMHCYHLKDWLIASGFDKDRLDNYIDSTIELKVCQKLTNSTKHLSETDPRSPQLFPWKKQELPSPISRAYDPFAKNQEESEYLEIMTLGEVGHGQPPHCFDFMRRCMEQWNEFLCLEKLERLRSI